MVIVSVALDQSIFSVVCTTFVDSISIICRSTEELSSTTTAWFSAEWKQTCSRCKLPLHNIICSSILPPGVVIHKHLLLSCWSAQCQELLQVRLTPEVNFCGSCILVFVDNHSCAQSWFQVPVGVGSQCHPENSGCNVGLSAIPRKFPASTVYGTVTSWHYCALFLNNVN